MNFGTSAGDALILVQLAWRTVQGAREACGEHDVLTREVSSLHKVLLRLQRELENPSSLLNSADEGRKQELNELGTGCERILGVLSKVVEKYNGLSEETRSGKRLWQKVRFGNGEMEDLSVIREKLAGYTSAVVLSLNLCSSGSQGRAERRLGGLDGELEGIRERIDWIAANMIAKNGEGSAAWTSFTDDEKGFWRELRHGLVEEGYRGSIIHRYKHLIKGYVEELGNRGVFDDIGGVERENSIPHDAKLDASKEEASREEGKNKDSEDAPRENLDAEGELELDFEERNARRARRSRRRSSSTSPPIVSQSNEKDPQIHRATSGRLPEDVLPALPMHEDNGLTRRSPQAAPISTPVQSDDDDYNTPQTSPESPRTSKYVRFDRKIHVGNINDRAKKARAPEEQAAHDERKAKARARKTEREERRDSRPTGPPVSPKLDKDKSYTVRLMRIVREQPFADNNRSDESSLDPALRHEHSPKHKRAARREPAADAYAHAKFSQKYVILEGKPAHVEKVAGYQPTAQQRVVPADSLHENFLDRKPRKSVQIEEVVGEDFRPASRKEFSPPASRGKGIQSYSRPLSSLGHELSTTALKEPFPRFREGDIDVEKCVAPAKALISDTKANLRARLENPFSGSVTYTPTYGLEQVQYTKFRLEDLNKSLWV